MASHRQARFVARTGLLTVSIFLAGIVRLPAQQPTSRLPVPDAAAQQKAVELVGEVYKEDYDKARAPAERVALAEKMLRQASEPNTDAAGRYVLLRIARDVAAGAGDAQTALGAVDEIARLYNVEAMPMKVEVLTTAAKTANLPIQREAVVEEAMLLIGAAVARDDYETAERLGRVASGVARRVRNASLAKTVVTLNRDVLKVRAAFEAAKKALAVWEENPADPAANLTAGKFYCLVKDDWEKGISMLALGSDAKLAELARKELKGPTSVDERVALGDGWWALAQAGEGTEKDLMMVHAGLLYERARRHVDGLLKAKLEKRLREIAGITAKRASGALRDPGAPRGALILMTFEPDTIQQRQGGVLVRDLTGNDNHGQVHGSPAIEDGKAGKAFRFDGKDDQIILPSVRAQLTADRHALSICAWLQVAGNVRTRFVFDSGFFQGENISVWIPSPGTVEFDLPSGYGGVNLKATTPAPGNWYHVACTWDGATQRIYVDGRLTKEAQTTSLVLTEKAVPKYEARIGSMAKKDTLGKRRQRLFVGKIDEFAIYLRALTEKEVGSVYQRGLKGNGLSDAGP